MAGVNPQDEFVRGSRSVRVRGLTCGFLLAVGAAALLAAPRALPGQEGATTRAVAVRTSASGLAPDPDLTSAARLLYSSDGPGLEDDFREAAGAAVALPAPRATGLSQAPAPLFRRLSTFERGWRLVGEAAGHGGDDLEDSAWTSWASDGGDAGSTGAEEPPFLVELFDAQELMAWIREARAWGMNARRTLFGPRGIVRTGSVPGSDRPRLRMELTDSRPGFQFVIITR